MPSDLGGEDVADAGGFLVCRAVQSLLAGGLDEATEPAFAGALGVSGGHLRRLFLHYVGVTPAVLAGVVRVETARRLLGSSDLKIADVAFAAGFRSVRQFNRAMVESYGLTPRALREARHRRDGHATVGELTARLPLPPHHDWSHTLELVGRRAAAGVECVDGTVYRRSIELAGDRAGLLEVRCPPSGAHVVVTVRLPSWSRLVHVMERVRKKLGLWRPADAAHWSTTPCRDVPWGAWGNTPHGTASGGRPLISEWTPFEAAVKAMLGVPDDPAGAPRLAALVQGFGRHLDGDPYESLLRFPGAEDLARTPPDHLALPANVAEPLVELASAIAEGSMPIFDVLAPSVRRHALCSISGVTDRVTERFLWLTGSIGAPSSAGQPPPQRTKGVA